MECELQLNRAGIKKNRPRETVTYWSCPLEFWYSGFFFAWLLFQNIYCTDANILFILITEFFATFLDFFAQGQCFICITLQSPELGVVAQTESFKEPCLIPRVSAGGSLPHSCFLLLARSLWQPELSNTRTINSLGARLLLLHKPFFPLASRVHTYMCVCNYEE